MSTYILLLLFIPLPFFGKMDPFYHILRLSTFSEFGSTLYGKIFRSIVLGLISLHWAVCSVRIVLYFAIYIFFATEIFAALLKDIKQHEGILKADTAIYKSISIIIHRCNAAVNETVAVAVAGAGGIFVCAMCATIRYYDRSPLLTYLVFPGTAQLMLVLVSFVLTIAGGVDARSRNVLKIYEVNNSSVNLQGKARKYNACVFRSLLPCSIKCGNYFYIKRTTLVSMYMNMLDQTISVLFI